MNENKYVIVLTVSCSVKRKHGKASVNTDTQLRKQDSPFARATRVWLAVNYEWILCSKRARACELGICQSNLCHSWGYQRFQKSKDSLKACFENVNIHMSRGMRFPTMWFVRPAKPQISLRIRAVWSEPLLVAWIFYDCLATGWTLFGVSKLKRRLHRLAESTLVKLPHCRKSHVMAQLC